MFETGSTWPCWRKQGSNSASSALACGLPQRSRVRWAEGPSGGARLLLRFWCDCRRPSDADPQVATLLLADSFRDDLRQADSFQDDLLQDDSFRDDSLQVDSLGAEVARRPNLGRQDAVCASLASRRGRPSQILVAIRSRTNTSPLPAIQSRTNSSGGRRRRIEHLRSARFAEVLRPRSRRRSWRLPRQ
jgi:hypothetical protein